MKSAADTRKVAALYVETDGVYFGRPDVDPWDVLRDARDYDGPAPVVAHPPCSRWCQLAYINQKRYGHSVGNDGGMFWHALFCVRRFGGVLEHPAYSHAWKHFGITTPSHGFWTQNGNEWVTQVSQRAYGHPARKRTWLLYVGDNPPDLDWSEPDPIAQVSFCKNHGNSPLPRLGKGAAKATPPAFAEVLIQMAKNCNKDTTTPTEKGE